ncbi:MAG: TRAP transporter small permease [Pseudolabrys sp.]|nr:TRAP transporter small permease [Pseudolabrys sp.]
MAGEKIEVIDDGLGGELPKPPPAPQTGFGRFTVGLSIIGTMLIIIMAIAVNTDVLGRNLFNHPVAGVTEFLGLAIVAVVFLQMANTAREGRHINNDLIIAAVAQINPRLAKLFYALFELIAAALFALVVWFVWPNFVDNYNGGYFKGTTGYIEIPLWPFTGIVVIGAAAASIQHLLLTVRDLRAALEK